MSAAQALKAAHDVGIRIGIDGDDLILDADAAPPAAVLDLLSRHKAAIVALLCTESDAGSAPVVDEAEREAIAIELGGVPEIYAKAFAAIQAHPPADIPQNRWERFIDDAGRFLDQWGAEAERLGWAPEELFGLDPIAPMARYDRMGLIWMLHGETVLELTAEGARLAGGLAFYRRPAQ